MKLIVISLFVYLPLLSFVSNAQLKIGYVDSDTIMDNFPDVQDARQKLDALIQEWQTEVRKLESDLKAKKDDYDKRKLIMTEQTSTEVMADITKLEKEIADYRDKKFGANGELFQKQNELMKPVQNKVFTIIQQIATEEEMDYVFDRSGDILFLYAKPEYDLTAKVIERLKLE
ncbi:MAG: OmpH family outer membrane protein [Ignavibacteriaceae bacterium]|jgi:outer membrane protein|nr:OmpH family outer membrane protein [Ignavibacteriaceae bacterium]MCU0364135.1 OmpH family outer membrane protein [Ignavibacteriaceae bacterium]MCU0405640.1 OmpH family outer membrane protein [Ignavibacteriaceae bacterium]MCU0412926.1 OmpH family outer membrane protein [Ignavibacteriaceae bacterium]